MSDTAEEVAKLKAEGNAFFGQKNFRLAAAKYSEAIQLDGSSAVLFANRAACYNVLKQFAKAESDAERATALDDKYPKAWARLAAAQEQYYQALSQDAEAVAHWRRAIDSLPKENPSPAEISQREQYEGFLHALEEKIVDRPTAGPSTRVANSAPGVVILDVPDGDAPWDRAKAMVPGLRARGVTKSSAYTLLAAYEDFLKGQQEMFQLRPVTQAGDMVRFFGQLGAIEKISQAVLTDSRAIHVAGNSDWMDIYNLQARFELTTRDAPNTAKPMEQIVAHARRLKERGGWDVVRPALATSVRCSIIFAFLQDVALHNHVQSVIVLDKVLEILRWGRTEWPHASDADRGVVFKDTFIRGVRTLRLNTYISALQSVGDRDALYSFSYDHVMEEGEALMAELRGPRDAEVQFHPDFAIAYYDVPEAQAITAQGFYFMQAGIALIMDPDGDNDQGRFALRNAHRLYTQGAETYPPDDERRVYFLVIALLALFRAGDAPLEETLPYIPRICEARDAAKVIWEHQSAFKDISAHVDKYATFERVMREQIAAGHITLKEPHCPSWASLGAAEDLQF